MYWKTHLILILILGLSFCFQRVSATLVYVSDFGDNEMEATDVFYAAINNAAHDTVVVDYIGAGKWITDIIYVWRNDLTLIFEPGVIVEAKENFGCGSLFMINSMQNIAFIGYGATLQMHKAEYEAGYPEDNCQFRNCISVNGCKNLKVYGLTLKDSGGDGIYLGHGALDFMPYCENVHIKDCVMDNNFRQGISITTSVNVLIENCDIKNTGNSLGVFPECGIDIEPDYAWAKLENLTIRNCRITDNKRWGILQYYYIQDETSPPYSINIENNYIANNGVDRVNWSSDEGGGLRIQVVGGMPSGQINIKNCLIENELGPGLRVLKKADQINVNIENCVFRDVMNVSANNYENPLWIEGSYTQGETSSVNGGVHFQDILVIDDEDRPIITYIEIYESGGVGAKDISGHLIGVNPFGISSNWGNNPINITLAITEQLNLPNSDVFITTSDAFASEEGMNTANFIVQRDADNDLTFPLAVLLDITGTATNRLDYCFQNRLSVIPANLTEQSTTLTAIKDSLSEETETVLVSILPDNNYSLIPPTDTILYIGETEADVADNDNDGYMVSVDCNDENENVNPGATEIIYNGEDDDCDEITLDDDLDQDGFVLANDCDDENENINPDGTEIFGNDTDENCDGMIDILIQVKIYLEGAYNIQTSMMEAGDNFTGLVPEEQVYYTEPWNYEGTETIAAKPDEMIDWVLIELVDEDFSILQRKACLLLNTGMLVDTAWINNSALNGLLFEVNIEQTYNIIVRHRNHLAVISAGATKLQHNMFLDFTNPDNVKGVNQLTLMEDGNYTLFAGDYDSNGVITVDDYNGYLHQVSSLNLYLDGDFNLDKSVTVSDFNLMKSNLSVIGVNEIRY